MVERDEPSVMRPMSVARAGTKRRTRLAGFLAIVLVASAVFAVVLGGSRGNPDPTGGVAVAESSPPSPAPSPSQAGYPWRPPSLPSSPITSGCNSDAPLRCLARGDSGWRSLSSELISWQVDALDFTFETSDGMAWRDDPADGSSDRFLIGRQVSVVGETPISVTSAAVGATVVLRAAFPGFFDVGPRPAVSVRTKNLESFVADWTATYGATDRRTLEISGKPFVELVSDGAAAAVAITNGRIVLVRSASGGFFGPGSHSAGLLEEFLAGFHVGTRSAPWKTVLLKSTPALFGFVQRPGWRLEPSPESVARIVTGQADTKSDVAAYQWIDVSATAGDIETAVAKTRRDHPGFIKSTLVTQSHTAVVLTPKKGDRTDPVAFVAEGDLVYRLKSHDDHRPGSRSSIEVLRRFLADFHAYGPPNLRSVFTDASAAIEYVRLPEGVQFSDYVALPLGGTRFPVVGGWVDLIVTDAATPTSFRTIGGRQITIPGGRLADIPEAWARLVGASGESSTAEWQRAAAYRVDSGSLAALFVVHDGLRIAVIANDQRVTAKRGNALLQPFLDGLALLR